MILAYDPVAGELIVDLEDDRPPFAIRIGQLQFKLYGHGGILYGTMATADRIEIMWYPVKNEPATLELHATATNSWVLMFVPLDV